MTLSKKLLAGSLVVATLAGAGVAGATVRSVHTSGSEGRRALVACPGGMSRLGHDFNEDMSIFPGDPDVHIENLYTVAVDFFKVEDIDMGSHAGTHLDVPAHFIEDGRTLDDLAAEEFLWPAYKIDVRDMAFENNQVEAADIRDYERDNGRIRKGSLVILQTGAEEFFGLGGTGDLAGESVLMDEAGDPILNEQGNMILTSDNTDDLFDFVNVGFSGAAVQWLFDNRQIDGVGSDAYGPDAATDENFDATFTALDNDGVALVGLKNLDAVSVRSDVIMAPAVNLTDGSGFSVDPLACHGVPPRGH